MQLDKQMTEERRQTHRRTISTDLNAAIEKVKTAAEGEDLAAIQAASDETRRRLAKRSAKYCTRKPVPPNLR